MYFDQKHLRLAAGSLACVLGLSVPLSTAPRAATPVDSVRYSADTTGSSAHSLLAP